MKETIENLEELCQRIDKACEVIDLPSKKKQRARLEEKMNAPDFWQDQKRAAAVSQQAAKIAERIDQWETLRCEAGDLLALAKEDKDNLEVNLRTEIDEQYLRLRRRFLSLEFELLLNNPHDAKSAILSIHAGAGGDDAQDWAEMLSRMYMRWAESSGYKTDILDSARGGEAGIKSITIEIRGDWAYGKLRSEHGVHRLVRLSPFDADHARHTSFALVEIVPELEDIDDVSIDERDLRIDTFMSSGHGGQSVNTTYSAVRVVHVPTGITVSCQNERSQVQNKETALKILKAKLQQLAEEQRVQEIKELKGEHKQAAWGNQIRSYVLHPYKMVKDLRTGYEEPDPEKVLDGEIDSFIENFLRWKASRAAEEEKKTV